MNCVCVSLDSVVGGIATIANVICKSINHPMVMLEACRVLLGLLFYTTRSQAERQAAVQALHDECERQAREAHEQAVAEYNLAMENLQEDEEAPEPPPDEIEVPEPDPDALANAAYGKSTGRPRRLRVSDPYVQRGPCIYVCICVFCHVYAERHQESERAVALEVLSLQATAAALLQSRDRVRKKPGRACR